jgi:hypothetical protein
MEGTIIISTADLRKIVREELEAVMLVAKESEQRIHLGNNSLNIFLRKLIAHL